MLRRWRAVFSIGAALATAGSLLSCEPKLAQPQPPSISLSFSRQKIPSLPDSAAYVARARGGRVVLVGFFTDCLYTMEGRLRTATASEISVDVLIRVEPVTCILDDPSRYVVTLSDVPIGQYRITLRHLVWSGVGTSDRSEIVLRKTVWVRP
jgi:hypothetical protein